jgi:tetratricopeptide (TPR) repeat protein
MPTRQPSVEVVEVTEPPFVGEEGVDAHGYPLRRPDKVTLLSLLREHKYAELDRFFEHYQSEFEADFHKEFWPDDAASAFYLENDATLEPWLDEWVKVSPESFAARLSRGNYRMARGWGARGHGVMSEVGEEQHAAMTDLHSKAVEDLQEALKMRPKLVVAYSRLIGLAGTLGLPKQQSKEWLDAALAVCPSCYEVRWRYLDRLTPRWGGSYAEMEAFTADLKPRRADNPKLALLDGFATLDRCKSSEKPNLAECDRAVALGDEPRFLNMRARYYNEEKNYEAAARLLDRALRIAPHDRASLNTRYDARAWLKNHLGAAEDLFLLRQLEPGVERHRNNLDLEVKRLIYDANQLFHAGKHAEAAPYYALALKLAPDHRKLPSYQAQNDKSMLDELKARLAANPHDIDLRRRIDGALMIDRHFEQVLALWNDYIEKHPDDPRGYYERGGTNMHLGRRKEALEDADRACKRGLVEACDRVRAMGGRPSTRTPEGGPR